MSRSAWKTVLLAISLLVCLNVTALAAEPNIQVTSAEGNTLELALSDVSAGQLVVAAYSGDRMAACATTALSGEETGVTLLFPSPISKTHTFKAFLLADDTMRPLSSPQRLSLPGGDPLVLSYAADHADIYRIYAEHNTASFITDENGYTHFSAYNSYQDEATGKWLISDECAGLLDRNGNIVVAEECIWFEPYLGSTDWYCPRTIDLSKEGLYSLSRRDYIIPFDHYDWLGPGSSGNGNGGRTEYIKAANSSETICYLPSTGEMFHLPAGTDFAGGPPDGGYMIGIKSQRYSIYPADGITVNCPVSDCSYIRYMGNGVFCLEKENPATGTDELGLWVAGSETMALDLGPYSRVTDLGDGLYQVYAETLSAEGSRRESSGIWSVQTGSFLFAPVHGQFIFRAGDLLVRNIGDEMGGAYHLDGTPICEGQSAYYTQGSLYCTVREGPWPSKCWLVSLDGTLAFPEPESAIWVINGKPYREVEKNGRYGVEDADGTTIVPLKYDWVDFKCDGGAAVFLAGNKNHAHEFLSANRCVIYLPDGRLLLPDAIPDNGGAVFEGNYLIFARKVGNNFNIDTPTYKDCAAYYIDPASGEYTVISDEPNDWTGAGGYLIGENLLFRNTLYAPSGEVLLENCSWAKYSADVLYCRTWVKDGAGAITHSITRYADGQAEVIIENPLPLELEHILGGMAFYDESGAVFDDQGRRLASGLAGLKHADGNLFYIRGSDHTAVYKITQGVCAQLASASASADFFAVGGYGSNAKYWALSDGESYAVFSIAGDAVLPSQTVSAPPSVWAETCDEGDFLAVSWEDTQRRELYFADGKGLALSNYGYIETLRTNLSYRVYLYDSESGRRGLCGVYDAQLHELIPCEYEYIQLAFGERYYELTKDGKCGLADLSGTVCIPVEYEGLHDQGSAILARSSDSYTLYGPVSGIMSPICTGWYITVFGDLAICQSLSGTGSLYHIPTGELLETSTEMWGNGAAPVYVYNSETYNYFYIAQNGLRLNSMAYSHPRAFYEGLACVGIWAYDTDPHYRFGFINEAGERVVPFRYLAANDLSGGRCWAMTEDGKWAIIQVPSSP